MFFVLFLLDGKAIQRKREMDKLLNKLDTNVCLKYNDTYSSVVGLFNFDISVLLNTIDNVYILL